MRRRLPPALLVLLLPLAATLLARGGAARAEELPPQVQQALKLASEFPAPDKALGFQFQAQGQRTDPATGQVLAEVELALRVEPLQEGSLKLWKTTEIWSAKTAQATSRRMVEVVLNPDLTPIRGSTYEDGTATATVVDWLGGDKMLAIQVKNKDKRLLRTAGYAGQPVVEVGGALLLARLLPKEFPRAQVDFCAPSWNKLVGDPQGFMGLVLVGGPGPSIQVQSPNAPEVLTIPTVSIQGYRDAKTLIFSVLRNAETGLPVMININGTTYGGDARPL